MAALDGVQEFIMVLSSFKKLHQARKTVFAGDTKALVAGRLKINEEFRKNIDEADPEKVEELLKIADDSALLLQTTVVQLKHNPNTDRYEMKLRKETEMFENIPYDSEAPSPKPRRRKTRSCKDNPS